MRNKVSATFCCKVCGLDTETVHFLPRGFPSNPCSSDAVTFDFESESMAVSEDEAAKVEQALSASDAAALYLAHHRWLATYCLMCRACYCKSKSHWVIESEPDPDSDWYSMHYDTYGTCPAGHKRLMAKDSLSWPKDE